MAIFISFICLANIKQEWQGKKNRLEKLKLRGLQETQEIKIPGRKQNDKRECYRRINK